MNPDLNQFLPSFILNLPLFFCRKICRKTAANSKWSWRGTDLNPDFTVLVSLHILLFFYSRSSYFHNGKIVIAVNKAQGKLLKNYCKSILYVTSWNLFFLKDFFFVFFFSGQFPMIEKGYFDDGCSSVQITRKVKKKKPSFKISCKRIPKSAAS